MGDMADFLLEEHGYHEDFEEQEDDYPILPTCKYCGKTIRWKKILGRWWAMQYSRDIPHVCNRKGK